MSRWSFHFQKMNKEATNATVNNFLNELKVEIKQGIGKVLEDKRCLVELLYDASSDGNFEVVKYLLEKRKDYFNKKILDEALSKAIYSDNVNVVKYLNEKGAEVVYSEVVYEAKNKDIIKYIIEKGADIIAIEIDNYPDKFGQEVNDFARKLYLTKYANK